MTHDIAIVGGGPSGLALAGILERSGLDYIVFERSAENTPPRGACLDLHRGSGQLAMEEAGCYEKFREYGRVGDFTIHNVFDLHGNKVWSWGEGMDAPELDRAQIKDALLTTVPPSKIFWRKNLTDATRDAKGQVVLSFDDGTTASGFKLVVGADGCWSKIRHLVTPAKPLYSGCLMFNGMIDAENPYYSKLQKKAGNGPMVVLGRSVVIWVQRQGDGHYRVEFGLQRPEDYGATKPVKYSDTEAFKALMLEDEFFGTHSEEIKDMLKAMTGPFRAWPLWFMPPKFLNWSPAPGVTLIGDAAHVTTPWVGDGANCAMRDSVILGRQLKEHGVTEKAVAEYEKDMFPYASDVIERSIASGKLFFDWNSPHSLMEFMVKTPIIGTEKEAQAELNSAK